MTDSPVGIGRTVNDKLGIAEFMLLARARGMLLVRARVKPVVRARVEPGVRVDAKVAVRVTVLGFRSGSELGQGGGQGGEGIGGVGQLSCLGQGLVVYLRLIARTKAVRS